MMFQSKNNTSSLGSIMSKDIEINGDINISGDILIYGKVYGNINSNGVMNRLSTNPAVIPAIKFL